MLVIVGHQLSIQIHHASFRVRCLLSLVRLRGIKFFLVRQNRDHLLESASLEAFIFLTKVVIIFITPSVPSHSNRSTLDIHVNVVFAASAVAVVLPLL